MFRSLKPHHPRTIHILPFHTLQKMYGKIRDARYVSTYILRLVPQSSSEFAPRLSNKSRVESPEHRLFRNKPPRLFPPSRGGMMRLGIDEVLLSHSKHVPTPHCPE